MNTSSTAQQIVQGMIASNLFQHPPHHEDISLNLPVITIYDNGIIRNCSNAAIDILGSSLDALRWRHIATFFPQLADMAIMQGGKVNPNLRFLSHIGHSFEVINRDGVAISCVLFFNEVEYLDRHYLRVIFRPIEPQYSML